MPSHNALPAFLPSPLHTARTLQLDACAPHCQSITNGHAATWTTVKINGTNPASAFSAWLAGSGTPLVDRAPYPSNPTCVGVGGDRT